MNGEDYLCEQLLYFWEKTKNEFLNLQPLAMIFELDQESSMQTAHANPWGQTALQNLLESEYF